MSQTTNTRFTGTKTTIANLDIWLNALYNKFDIMEGRLKALEDDNRVKDTTIADLTIKINSMHSSTIHKPTYANITGGYPDSYINDAALVKRVEIEKGKQNKLECNLMWFESGLKDSIKLTIQEKSDDDIVMVKKIMNEIGIDSTRIVKTIRIQRKDKNTANYPNIPELVNVQLDSNETRQKAIKNCKKLRENSDYNNIYINLDKTINERNIDFNLRKERNERNSKLEFEAEEVNGSGRQRYTIYKDKKYYWGIRNSSLKWIEIK